MAHPERFERPTLWFVAKYSIQLSYGRQGLLLCNKNSIIHYFALCGGAKSYSATSLPKTKPSQSEVFGGERGIRTLDTGLSPYASLAGKCLRPLGQLTLLKQSSSNSTNTAHAVLFAALLLHRRAPYYVKTLQKSTQKRRMFYFFIRPFAIMRFRGRMLYATRVQPVPCTSLRSRLQF